jgi:Putative prokaryotic signal transducing protein
MSNATEHDELVTVATFPEPIEAAVARSALEAAGIDVYLRGETANSMVPVAFTAQLQVRAEDEQAARALLDAAEAFQGSDESLSEAENGDASKNS